MSDQIPKPRWALLSPTFDELMKVEDDELDKLIEEGLRLRRKGVCTDGYSIAMTTANSEQVGPAVVALKRWQPLQMRRFTIEAVERHLAERQAT
ncbi:MAG: hypothetical protein OXG68_02240 [Chloroflexi bacterium]|nr:hypothetical protein [Chloroflexota bacterium]